jgi:hypothetical protein
MKFLILLLYAYCFKSTYQSEKHYSNKPYSLKERKVDINVSGTTNASNITDHYLLTLDDNSYILKTVTIDRAFPNINSENFVCNLTVKDAEIKDYHIENNSGTKKLILEIIPHSNTSFIDIKYDYEEHDFFKFEDKYYIKNFTHDYASNTNTTMKLIMNNFPKDLNFNDIIKEVSQFRINNIVTNNKLKTRTDQKLSEGQSTNYDILLVTNKHIHLKLFSENEIFRENYFGEEKQIYNLRFKVYLNSDASEKQKKEGKEINTVVLSNGYDGKIYELKEIGSEEVNNEEEQFDKEVIRNKNSPFEIGLLLTYIACMAYLFYDCLIRERRKENDVKAGFDNDLDHH